MPLGIKDVTDVKPAPHIGRPPPDSSSLPEGYKYVPVTFRMRQPTIKDLAPYMVATAYAVLGLLLLQWSRKSWSDWIADVVAWTACVSLHHFQQPLLALNLALAYTVWSLLPGSFAATNLPSHSTFMRNLKVQDKIETSAECSICWGDECGLAEIPCGHQFCKPCLQQMGEGKTFQTTCPICRLPLFGANDRLRLIVTKGHYSCWMLIFAKCVMELALGVMTKDCGDMLLYLVLIAGLLLLPCTLLWKLRANGVHFREWWTAEPEITRTRNELQISGSLLITSILMTGYNIWADLKYFR